MEPRCPGCSAAKSSLAVTNAARELFKSAAPRPLSNCWMMRASFGWNDFRQFISPQSIKDPNNLWALGGQNDDNTLAVGYSSKAYLFINGHWQFNVTGLYQAPFGINIGTNFFGRQGYPFLPYVRASTHDVAANLYQLDFRVERAFQVGPVTVTPAAEVFNVLNSGTVLQRYSRVGTYNNGAFSSDPSFYTIQETQSPRILRLGLRMSF